MWVVRRAKPYPIRFKLRMELGVYSQAKRIASQTCVCLALHDMTTKKDSSRKSGEQAGIEMTCINVTTDAFQKIEVSNFYTGKSILSSFIGIEIADERAGPSNIGVARKFEHSFQGVNEMSFETPFPPAIFAGTITALQHEHGGVAPATIIRTDQSWAVNVNWQTTGIATGMICGEWHLHAYLESIGPGPDLDLVDAVSPGHIIPLTPGP